MRPCGVTQCWRKAAVVVDAYNKEAAADAKELVSCRMVRRQLGSGEGDAISISYGSDAGFSGGSRIFTKLDHEQRQRG